MSNDSLERLQQLLRTIFQFDSADLDFGIYRILNYKRDRIEQFLTKELPEVVRAELERGALAEQSGATKQLEELQKKVRDALGSEAMDADGNLAEAYHDAPLGKKYLEARAKTTGAKPRTALETAIFSHLYSFFNRYYSDGDFMSKRRYSKREKYVIPYNGEEVYLHWANSDQYYIKTDEYFRDYSFQSRGITVHFKIQDAQIEPNNVKGEKRLFIPLVKQAAFDAKKKEIVIPFEFRPLTEQEEITYGKRNQQESILTEALGLIPKHFQKESAATAALLAERGKRSDGSPVSFLEYHLRQYTRRNTSDFFIHKNLKGFLSRELDFYLKNEVLNLDEMEVTGEDRSEGWFQIMRVIKAIGRRIIEFLAQIENFQKMLFEKKKFVTETNYCITVRNIPEGFYQEIADNEAQWVEWKELFHIDEEQRDLFTPKSQQKRRLEFLKKHPTLVLDTKHFNKEFMGRLLASFDNLDEMTDGLLIHSENFQALNTLTGKCLGKVDGVYIDPPYNSPSSEIIYKNNYKHSSWASLMYDRLKLSQLLQKEGSGISCAIDDNEVERLRYIMAQIFTNSGETVVIRANPAGRSTPKGFSLNHEYAIFNWKTTNTGNIGIGRLPHTQEQEKRYKEQDEIGSFEWVNFRKHGGLREEAPQMCYPVFIDKEKRNWRIPEMRWNEERNEWIPLEKPMENEVVVWPIGEGGQARRWKWSVDRLHSSPGETKVDIDKKGDFALYIKSRKPPEGVSPPTWWDKKEYSATDWGTRTLKNLFGKFGGFDYPKAVDLVIDCLRVISISSDDCVLDFFAGSGTTGHAIINLNREDAGSRKFILVEMGEYFDSVLIPRIKKVTFAPEWRNGKPRRGATKEEAERSPRVIKYIRLESYEDALNNIFFTLPKGQKMLGFDDYLLKYMLEWETKKSETFLNVEKLSKPFSYELTLTEGQETKKKIVDIPETFNYLLGLHVKTRRVYNDKDRRYLVYRGNIDHREVVVIWRDTEGWTKKDLERDKKFVAEQEITKGADEIFVNGDTFIPKAKALDPVFKRRMFSGVEV